MQSVASARWTSQPSITRKESGLKQRAVVCPSFSAIRKGTQLSVRKQVSISATAGTAVPSRFDTLPEVPDETEACVSDQERCKLIKVTVRKPMGMVLVEDKGHVKVESLTPGGNAELSGLVKPGDIVVRCSATVLKGGKEANANEPGQAAYDNYCQIMFDCVGQSFGNVMGAIASNSSRWGIFHVKLELSRALEG